MSKAPKKRKVTPSERKAKAQAISSLGGKARAAKLTKEQRSKISAKAGLISALRNDPEHYATIARKKWDDMSPEQQAAERIRLKEIGSIRLRKSRPEG